MRRAQLEQTDGPIVPGFGKIYIRCHIDELRDARNNVNQLKQFAARKKGGKHFTFSYLLYSA